MLKDFSNHKAAPLRVDYKRLVAAKPHMPHYLYVLPPVLAAALEEAEMLERCLGRAWDKSWKARERGPTG